MIKADVPENLLDLFNMLSILADTEPVIAEHVFPIVEKAFVFAMASGKVTDPDVWIRAFKGAATLIETRKADDTWLAMLPVNRE